MVVFIQHLQSLVTFKEATFVKVNVATFLWSFTLEWYIFELSNFDHNALNNNLCMKSWINTLSYCFKVPISVAFGLLTNKTYFLDNAYVWQSLAQYVCTIIWYGIGCNIVDVANQLSFTYWGLALELRVFVSPSTKSIRISDFIHTFEDKQKVWHKIMTTLVTSHKYYNSAQRPSPFLYKLPFPSQSKVFSYYQSQQCIFQAQLPWHEPKRFAGLSHAASVPTPQHS